MGQGHGLQESEEVERLKGKWNSKEPHFSWERFIAVMKEIILETVGRFGEEIGRLVHTGLEESVKAVEAAENQAPMPTALKKAMVKVILETLAGAESGHTTKTKKVMSFGVICSTRLVYLTFDIHSKVSP